MVGTASIIIERKFIRNGGLVGHIEDVAVRADRQRLGIGTKLIEHLTAEAFRMGCYKVILNALGHVTGFYARLGYKAHDSGLRVNKADWSVVSCQLSVVSEDRACLTSSRDDQSTDN